MGCLFPCFRARAAQSTTNSPVSQRGHESKKNRLSDLFLSEEEKAPPSPCIHTDKHLNDENTNSKIPEKAGESTLSVTCEGKLEDSSASVSPWVKQSEEKSNNNISTITSRDRPIIGMVAAHWNEKEQSQISPKWWDGNGIPNSTNKYKEDQKVSWHATPFEERLEKALSEEGGQGFISSRKLEVMEDKERDTAISQLHHSAQSTSIVSF
ncbi:unnamed protein product [Brassica rapa subsp. trilocularis]